MKFLAVVTTALAAVTFAAPAAAELTTFSTFSATGGANVRWVNSGTSSGRSNDATYYTTSSASATSPGSALVNFSFINTVLGDSVNNISALYTLNAVVAKNSAATVVGSTIIQSGISGTFSFLTTSDLIVSGYGLATTFYAAGSNLLSGSFNGSSLLGTTNGSAGATFASGFNGGTLTFTSDFLNFGPEIALDRTTSLNSITPALGLAANGAIKSFRAVTGGQFSADPVPVPTAAIPVPEPATWAMLIVGFGMVGAAKRHRAIIVRA